MAQGKGRAFQGLVSLGGPRIITPLLTRRNKRINDGRRLPKNRRSGRESLRFVPLLLFRNSSSRWKKRRPLSNAIEQQIYERLFLWKTAKNSIGLGKSWTIEGEIAKDGIGKRGDFGRLRFWFDIRNLMCKSVDESWCDGNNNLRNKLNREQFEQLPPDWIYYENLQLVRISKWD